LHGGCPPADRRLRLVRSPFDLLLLLLLLWALLLLPLRLLLCWLLGAHSPSRMWLLLLLLLLHLLLPLLLLPLCRQCCIHVVPQQGAAHSRHLCPYLVGTARHQLQGGLIPLRAPLGGSSACEGHLIHLEEGERARGHARLIAVHSRCTPS
jgi:hypothetical protein